MEICGLEKSSLVDYENLIVATVFTRGCNFRCPFCHNSSLVVPQKFGGIVPEDEVIGYLNKRKGVLDGLCVTGGEPTMEKGLYDFLQRIKDMGFIHVKLDTNGTSPEVVKRLIEDKLIDYCAMDIKNSKEKYAETVGLNKVDLAKIEATASILEESKISYELRTTVVGGLHTEDDIDAIGKWMGGDKKYYLQRYKDSGDCLNPDGLISPEIEEMHKLKKIAEGYFSYVGERGV